MDHSTSTTIVLADDHHIVRQGLRALLEVEKDLQVVGEAGDGLEAVQTVESLGPKVLVLDLMMPGLNGLDVLKQIKKRSPNTQIVILSMYANEAYVLEALSNGASAYVLKDSKSADLVQAVREAAAGRRYLSPPLTARAIEVYQERAQATSLDRYDTLTAREREVLHLAAEGMTNSEIAVRLGISSRTAETHRANLMHKLDMHSQAELIRFALRRGIIPMEG
ncbi:MAG TPA: response regulator transcription factor [Pyrinomonadaceae bacterium]|nr:response regulator transcription factor [Pyrinomonadaceae bacterium]